MTGKLRQGLPVVSALALALAGCAGPASSDTTRGPVDPQATETTRALFMNLRDLAPTGVLFGHQDDLAYGVHWWDEPGGSDVRAVSGAYPAVFGWELGGIEKGGPENLDRVPFERIRDWMVKAYELGAVNTVSWHANNPVSGGDAWDTTAAVAAILPGGSHHELYRSWLDTLAAFFLSVRTAAGEPVPVIFRPFHEMSGGWFWWGTGSTAAGDYRTLWRFTVEYLRDRKAVHNLLYAYSTGGLAELDEGEYWTWYPGDEYVDVLGFDDYFTLQRPGPDGGPKALATDLAWLVAQAEARGKIPAFTETGYETIPDPEWWTDCLLTAFTAEPAARRIAWVLVWRNANAERDRAGHFYAPYPGHASAENFAAFKDAPLILFGDELPPLYRTDVQ
ncbi:MAG: glycoside hydrolase family 26 protein [Gemmatimonadota bacterium]